MRTLLCGLLLLEVALADSVSDAADEVLRPGADLAALAARQDPDPWLVADELCDRGEHEAAARFAAAGKGPDFEALPRYLASRRGGPPDREARRAFESANRARFEGHPEEALRIVAASKASPASLWHPRLLFTRAFALHERGDAAGGAASFTEAAKASAALGWWKGALGCWLFAGQIAQGSGDLRAALAAFEQHLAIDRRRGDPVDLAESLNRVGIVRRDMGEAGAARDLHREALAVSTGAGQPLRIAESSRCLAAALEPLAEYREALALLERATAICRELRLPGPLADALNDLGNIHDALADDASAERCFAESQEIATSVGYHERVVGSRFNLANLHLDGGDYARALGGLEGALAGYRELRDAFGEGRVHLSLGILRARIGDPASARAAFEEAQRLGIATGSRSLLQSALGNLAQLLAEQGSPGRAMALLEESVALLAEMGDLDGLATARETVARLLVDQGHAERALPLLAEALAFHEKSGDPRKQARVLGNLGDAHQRLRDYAKARDCRRRAIGLARRIGARRTEVINLFGLAIAEFGLRNADAGIEAIRLAVERLPLLVRGLSEQESIGARRTWAPLLETAASAGLVSGDMDILFTLLETQRAMALLEALGARRANAEGLIPKDLLREDGLAQADERAAEVRLLASVAAGRTEEEASARAGYDAAQARRLDVLARIQRTGKAGANLLYPSPLALPQASRLLKEGEALVLFALPVEGAFAMVVEAGAARAVDLGPIEPIVAACGATREAASDPRADPGAAIARLRDLVWAPLLLKAKRILVSPDGPLAQVPFALLAPEAEIVSIPSASSVLPLRDGTPPRGTQVLALGNPRCEMGGLALSVFGRLGRIRPLPRSALEATAVGDDVLLEEKATEGAFLEALRRQPHWRALHFACHGFVHPSNPLLCALALAPDARHDGFLTAAEVYRLPVAADLVVLSACETARGKEVRAEGSFGLVRAFLVAGAPTVVSSLWPVDDEATRLLFERFYAVWKGGGTGAAAALRNAQRQVREYVAPSGQRPYVHPFYWAAWVVSGS